MYFSSFDYLKARLGSNPSYTWMSTYSGEEICFLRVIDGVLEMTDTFTSQKILGSLTLVTLSLV